MWGRPLKGKENAGGPEILPKMPVMELGRFGGKPDGQSSAAIMM